MGKKDHMKKILLQVYLLLFVCSVSFTVISSPGGIAQFSVSGVQTDIIHFEGENRDVYMDSNRFSYRQKKVREARELLGFPYKYFIFIVSVLMIKYLHCSSEGLPHTTLQSQKVRLDN